MKSLNDSVGQAPHSEPEIELNEPTRALRYVEHGYPHHLVRWHCHKQYELHYIVTSSGKFFMGDYIGDFGPGHLALAGPDLPHNWVCDPADSKRYALRDMVVQFEYETVQRAAEVMPELKDLLPFLEVARNGLEFEGMSDSADRYLRAIRDSEGSLRLGYFLQFMHELANCKNYRTLSSARITSNIDSTSLGKVNTVVNYVTANYHENITLRQMADLVGMNEAYFSRFFRKATGNTFVAFLAQIRISKACELLSTTDRLITDICYEVGYRNVANFNRRFSERKNMTPREYRQQTRQRLTRRSSRETV